MKTKTTPEQASPAALLTLLTFSLGEQRYALPIDEVVEVASMVERVTVKDSRPEIVGLVNRHGTVLPLLDLRLVFGHVPRPFDMSTLFIVAADGEQQVGLVVDEVHQVEYLPSSQERETSTAGTLIRGIISYEEQLVQIISPAALLETYLAGGIESA